MTRFSIETGLKALALGGVLALAATPALAQNRQFWLNERRSVMANLNRAAARVDELHVQLRSVGDNATGCRLSRSLRSALMDMQVSAEKVANIDAQLGNDEAHRAAVDIHNAALAERKRMESGILVQCANLGL